MNMLLREQNRSLKQALCAAVCVAFAAFALALVGCSALGAESEGLAVGQTAEGSAAVAIMNGTGKDIEAFYLKGTQEEDYGEALAQEGLLAADSLAKVAYPAGDAAMDLKFKTNDGALYELQALKLSDMQDATVKLSASGTTCYVEYTSKASGQRVSVVEGEQRALKEEKAKKKAKKALKEQKAATEAAEKKAKKAEEALEKAKKDAEAAAAAQAAANASESSDDSYSSGSSGYSSYSGSSSSSSSSSGSSSSSKSSGSSSSSSGKSSGSSGSSSSSGGSSSSSGSSGGGSSAPSGGTEDTRCIEL